jgi:aminoglycoside phosphotransferase
MLDSLRRRFRGLTWVPVTLGLSGDRVWRVDGKPAVYVKTAEHSQRPDSGRRLAAEASRLRWLATQGMPVPEVIEVGTDDQFAWLVTTAVAGRTAADPWPETDRVAVVDALADVALGLHALATEDCPFDRSLAVTVPEAIRAAESGLVDTEDFDAERDGWTAQQLVNALTTTQPSAEDLVVAHGDFCLPNVLLDPQTHAVTGLIDVGRTGVADRHTDLALITRSLTHEMNADYGKCYADRFLARYAADGAHIDPSRLAFYRLLDEFF